ncbi:UNVERIFIED_CONTAM: hypothetical protein Sradi_2208900 [Sesamum radiatum]|uniref:DUF4408 domain-containing protein n=1 Tax=Sesamum radiatum TaxID=300843 RepID=A0AAW2T4V4_SESRA
MVGHGVQPHQAVGHVRGLMPPAALGPGQLDLPTILRLSAANGASDFSWSCGFSNGVEIFCSVAVNGIPAMWSIILSWMKPPYLYIIINGIIITIAASTRFHQSQPEQPAARSEHLISVKTPPPSTFASFSAQMDIMSVVQQPTAAAEAEVVVSEVEDAVVELKPVMVNGSKIDVDIKTEEEIIVVETQAEAEDVFVDSTSSTYNTLPQKIISQELQVESLLPAREKPLFPVREKPLLPVREKPPASSRFGHRRPIRNSPEVSGVRSLKVAKPKRQETLESTWKMITEGRHVPLTRHLKKSDTWEHHHPPTVDQVTKSETFKERSNYESPAASLRIRKEPSLSQEELNRRVEAFIHKFNEEMRMQRQESLNQYMEMINRGV